ncbi:MAG TPA: glycosyltransferase, partial [Pirellulales bacterium]|nr:glycosyltransferase [Pirellulales bacterium]
QLGRNTSFKVLAISDPVFHYGEVIFQAWDLALWLSGHTRSGAQPSSASPEGLVESSGVEGGWGEVSKRLLGRVGLRRPAKRIYEVIRPAASAAKRAAKTIADLGLRRSAQRAWRVVRGGGTKAHFPPPFRVRRHPDEHPGPERCAEHTSTFISMRDLDGLISFNCYDAIWDWPTEFYECRLIGFFHDAIPLRVADIPDTDRGLFFCSVAKMVSRAHCIACDSASAQSDLHTFFSCAQPRTCIVYPGHDLGRFAPDESPQSHSETTSRRVPSKNDQQRTIAVLLESEPRKNRAGALRACRHLAALRPDERITLMLIGRTPAPDPYAWLEREASRYVEVIRLGDVACDRLGDVLRSCDVFVYPSLWEGSATPILEAMTAGVPVVCAENSALTELGGAHVFYCDPYDPASIAAAASRALSLDDQQRERWLSEARHWAGQFTWERTAEHLVKLIHERAALARPATSWAPPRSAPAPSHAA